MDCGAVSNGVVERLRSDILKSLKSQGYVVDQESHTFALMAPKTLPDEQQAIRRKEQKDNYRNVHQQSCEMKLKQHEGFLNKHKQLALAKDHIIQKGENLHINEIQPRLIEVESGSKWDKLFRWWNLRWWSVAYEKPIGRQMRFIIYDSGNQAIMGLIGLQSPILSWQPRDSYLNLKRPGDDKVRWINQSLNAQRVGAMPPYNQILGSRLIASILLSEEIRQAFARKYKGRVTNIRQQVIPNRLLFVTTTGAFGRTPVFDRHNYEGHKSSYFLGYTRGYGSFHITDDIYVRLLQYLESIGIDNSRGYGTGPSRKMKLISLAMRHLGFKRSIEHQIKRGIYLFTAVDNLKNVIHHRSQPNYINLSIDKLTDVWKERWLIPRLSGRQDYREFNAQDFRLETDNLLGRLKNVR